MPSDPGRPLPASLLLPAIGNLGLPELAGILSFPCTHTHKRSDARRSTCKHANTHLGRAGQAAVLKEALTPAPQSQRPEYATRLYSSDYPQGYRLAKGYTRLLKGRSTATPPSPTVQWAAAVGLTPTRHSPTAMERPRSPTVMQHLRALSRRLLLRIGDDEPLGWQLPSIISVSHLCICSHILGPVEYESVLRLDARLISHR